jgi:hypothetical protein
LAEFACRNVYERDVPVLYVVHDHNDDWEMLCGGNEHDSQAECVVLHKEHLANRDPGLTEVFDLLPGWAAERESADAPWTRQPFAENDDD